MEPIMMPGRPLDPRGVYHLELVTILFEGVVWDRQRLPLPIEMSGTQTQPYMQLGKGVERWLSSSDMIDLLDRSSLEAGGLYRAQEGVIHSGAVAQFHPQVEVGQQKQFAQATRIRLDGMDLFYVLTSASVRLQEAAEENVQYGCCLKFRACISKDRDPSKPIPPGSRILEQDHRRLANQSLATITAMDMPLLLGEYHRSIFDDLFNIG